MMRNRSSINVMLSLLGWLAAVLPALAQVTSINLSIPRDSIGLPGDVIRVPVILNTDLTSENAIAFRLEFTHSANLKPVSISKDGSLISSWSAPLVNYDRPNNQFLVTGAGATPITGTGALFYIDFELLPTGLTYNTDHGIYLKVSGANNYFNEGGYTISMDYGSIKIMPIIKLGVTIYGSPLTRGDSSLIYVSNGTGPYSITSSDPSVATITGGGYLKAKEPGFVTVSAVDANGKDGTSSPVEVRGMRLGFTAPSGNVSTDTIEVTVTTTTLTGLNVLSGSFDVSFSGVELIDVIQPGTLLAGAQIEKQNASATLTKISFASSSALSSGNVLLKLKMRLSYTENTGYAGIYARNILFNEDLPGNYQDLSFSYPGLPKATLSGSADNRIPGEVIQFTATNGTPPYTWSVTNPQLATIDANGLMTVLKGGTTKVRVEDATGQISESASFTLLDGRVTVSNEVGVFSQQHDLPVMMTALPTGREVSAFSFTLQLDTTYLKLVDIIQAGTLSNDFTIVKNATDERYVKIAGASTTAVGDAGVLMYLRLQLKPALAINSTSYVYLNSLILNEGVPNVIAQYGSVRAGDPPPTAANFSLEMDEDTNYFFSTEEFSYSQVQGKPFAKLLIEMLPAQGALQLNGNAVYATQQIDVSSFGQFRYVPVLNSNGSGIASFKFRVGDGSYFSNAVYTATIDILPVNDPPSFSLSETTYVRDEDFEDTISITPVPDAPADEQTQVVTYSLSPNEVSFANVSVNENTGLVTITSVPDGVGSQEFFLVANDGTPDDSLYQKAFTLTVNNVNKVPVLNDLTVSIEENTSPGTLVQQLVASDPDGNSISYEITSGNINDAFAIDGATGAITVANVLALDFETTPQFVLVVTASDGVLADEALITINLIDVNEVNFPVINAQTFSLAENSNEGTIVDTVNASDPNGDPISFAIVAGNTGDAFVLNDSSGILSVNNSVVIDYESFGQFNLVVAVTDGVNESFAVITVMIEDVEELNSPTIEPQQFSISENSPLGTNVGTIIATDPNNDPLVFALVSGNTGDAFALAANGTLTVSNPASLDYEATPEFSLLISVSDGTFSSSAVATVLLTDVVETSSPVLNDQAFETPENGNIGTLVGTVNATDPDSDPLLYSIVGGSDVFSIDPATGELTVIDSAPLDFETSPEFQIIVSVSDGTSETFANINISLTDVPLTVTGFDPATGAEGSQVAIYGTDFGVEVADVVVRFNGTAAQVQSVSPTEILATVPAGVTAGPISVYVKGQEAFSSQIFTPPAGPVALAALQVTPSSFKANWRSFDGATGYELDVSADDFTSFLPGYSSKVVSDTFDIVSNLSANTVYKYRVRAITGSGLTANSGTSTVTTLAKYNQTITFNPLDARLATDLPFDAEVTSSSGLPVTLSSSDVNVATVNGITITIIAAGTITITASQPGNEDYNPASEEARVLVITKVDQTITFPEIGTKTLGDGTVTLSAMASSGLMVAYSTSSDKITLSGNVGTLVKAGRVAIQADQAGDGRYSAAPTEEQSFCVNPEKPVLSLTSDNNGSPVITSSAQTGNQWYLNGNLINGANQPTLTVTGPGIYTVTATVDDCTSEVSDPQTIILTGDIEVPTHDVELNLYPNPVSDRLFLTWKGNNSRNPVTFVIYDLTGRKVWEGYLETDRENVLDVVDFPDGQYFVRCIQGRTVKTQTFLKE